MKKLIVALAFGALMSGPVVSLADEIVRFAPLKPEELTPAQKADQNEAGDE